MDTPAPDAYARRAFRQSLGQFGRHAQVIAVRIEDGRLDPEVAFDVLLRAWLRLVRYRIGLGLRRARTSPGDPAGTAVAPR